MKNPLRLFVVFFIIIPAAFYGQQIENPGFEYWEDAGTVKDEPVDWSTIKTCDDPGIAAVAPVTFEQSTDAHSGNYSLKLFNIEVFGVSATGAISNGMFHAEFNLDSSYSFTDQVDPRWNTVFTSRPDSLVGWFKYFPSGNDAAQFKAILHVDSCKLPENGTLHDWVGMAFYKTAHGVTYENWTRFSVPFNYYNDKTPEFLLCVINAGDSTISVPDSWLLVDDLEFKYNSSGIDDLKPNNNFLSQEGNNRLIVTLEPAEIYINYRFSLTDLSGRQVFSTNLESSLLILPSSVNPGIYVAILEGKENRFIQKVMIR
jgi:hypothetical protein